MKGDINELHKWSKDNKPVLDTADWEVAYLGGLAGGTGLGVSGLFFAFRSLSLEQYLRFVFLGGGPAVGTAGGWDDPQIVEFDCSRADWRELSSAMREPFSASNLCNAKGRVSVISLATPGTNYLPVGWGGTHLILTALYDGPKRSEYLFDKFTYNGTGFGTSGLGLGVFFGKWQFLGIPEPFRIDNNWTKPVCK